MCTTIGQDSQLIQGEMKRSIALSQCSSTILSLVEFHHPMTLDVMAAIDDLESQFQHCEWHGHLDESGADFMKD